PFTFSITLSVGTRTSPKYSVRLAFRTRSSRVSFALFSWPEYVWTMYHFFSVPSAGLSPLPGRSPSSAEAEPWPGSVVAPRSPRLVPAGLAAIDQLRDVRPDQVEQAEDDRRDDRHDDHGERGGADFLGGGPGDLLQLARDLVGEVIDAVVAIEGDADHSGDDRGDHRDLGFRWGGGEVPPDPGDAPLQPIEKQHRPTQ